MTGKEFVTFFEQYFPIHLAEKWDNVGLQLGTLEESISGILIALDLTSEVLDEAIRLNYNFILVHHPMIFSPIKKITFNSYLGSLIQKAIKHDITVYVAHTNFDISNVGMNKILADMLHIKNQKIIEYTTETEGLGIYGNIEETTPDKFIRVLKNTFELEKLSIIGLLSNKINTVAICGGSGSSLLKNPKLSNVDAYITGDITYHHALDAKNAGITVVDVGHNIEKFGLVGLKSFLNSKLSVPIELTKVNTNPYIIK